MNEKTLVLFTGISGSGKDWTCSSLNEAKGIPMIRSYATRNKRDENEDIYEFISYEDVNKYMVGIVQSFIDVETHNVYFSTIKQLQEMFKDNDIATLIVTPQSVESTFELLTKFNINCIYVHILPSYKTRLDNMKKRGDPIIEIELRKNLDMEINKHYADFLKIKDNLEQKGLTFFEASDSNKAFDFVIEKLFQEKKLTWYSKIWKFLKMTAQKLLKKLRCA